ncbi:biotin--[acetyl-CoA-carboxylase] ligase [bacterium]|nr:biotin--[acetyl-CoA-carboxylase] ligase [bacterium]
MRAWDEKQLHWHLTTRRFGRQFVYLDEVDSTNRFLKENPEIFTLSGGVLIAGHQSAGRGRQSRLWSDCADSSLLFSLALRLHGQSDSKGMLSLLPAIALGRTIRNHDTGADVELKWPNDVLLSHRKVAGILAESSSTESGETIVIGVGINVNSIPSIEFAWPAISLWQGSAWHPSREVLLAELLNAWEPLFDAYMDGAFDSIRESWEELGPRYGSRMRRVEFNSVSEGEFVGLGLNGQLLLRLSSGEIQEVFSGDIQLQ